MAELSTVARPYAEALFKLCPDAAATARWSDVLAFLEAVLQDAQLAPLVGNPRVPVTQLLGLIGDVGGDRLDADARQFLAVLAHNGRLALVGLVRAQFEVLRQEREGVLEAQITSAFALDEGQVAQLVRGLEARFQRGIRPTVAVDSSLIGGVRLAVGDVVIDGSVRGRLDRMEAALKS